MTIASSFLIWPACGSAAAGSSRRADHAAQQQGPGFSAKKHLYSDRIPSKGIRWILWVILLSAAGPVVGFAADRPRISQVELGFGGGHRVGCWTPLRVTVTGGAQPEQVSLRLVTLDGDGVDVAYEDQSTVSIPAGGAASLSGYVKFGRVQAPLRVELVAAGQVIASRALASGEFPPPLPATHQLMVTLGELATLDEDIRRRVGGRESLSFRAVSEPATLPERWIGFEGVSTLVVTTADNAALQRVSSRQWQAIERWVRMGGRLVLSLGALGQEVLAEQQSPLSQLARFVPGRFVEVTTLRNGGALESFSGSSQRLDLQGGRNAGLPITLLADVQGQITISERGLRARQPLVIGAPFGFGQVVFVAFDLDHPQLEAWGGRSRLVARILRGARQDASSERRDTSSRRVAHVGYQDLAGQLRSGLDQFSGVKVVPFFLIAGLILAYVTLIGPGDYFLLNRFIGRMPMTWVTFPVVSLLFVGLGLLLHHRLKDDRVQVNQVDLLDVDTIDSLVRGTTWSHVYSPRTQTYDFRLDAGPLTASLLTGPLHSVLSWQGLPGNGLGGLNTTSQAIPFAPAYSVSLDTTLSDAPIPVTSTKALLGRWWGEADLVRGGRLTANSDGLLEGPVINPLSAELTDCVVLFGNWAYRLESVSGSLKAGESTLVELEKPLNLEWRLTRRRVVEAEDVHVPWNQSNLDIPEILEMMMFHGAAGGETYTRLTHRYQGFVDLTNQINSGRAVLLGRTVAPATQLSGYQTAAADAYDRHWTFCRILFPVENWRREDPAVRSLGTAGNE